MATVVQNDPEVIQRTQQLSTCRMFAESSVIFVQDIDWRGGSLVVSGQVVLLSDSSGSLQFIE